MPKYEIALFADPKLQVRYHKAKDKWGIRYKARRKGETQFQNEWRETDAKDREEAVQLAEEFYLRQLQEGAIWVEHDGRPHRPLKKQFKSGLVPIEDKDKYIHTYEVPVTRYRVRINHRTIKAGFESVEEARKFRDNYLRGGAKLKVCKLCGKRPVWHGSGVKGSASLIHKEPGCPNHVHIGNRELDAVAKIFAWNDHFSDGSKPGWGNVTSNHLFSLGVFAKMTKTTREKSGTVKTRGGKRKVREEQVFEDFHSISDDEV